MAALTATATFGSGQFRYIDTFGIEHTVNTNQILILAIDDNSSTDVRYSIKALNACTLTDGRRLRIRQRVMGADSGNTVLTSSPLADAQDGQTLHSIGYEFQFECPESGTRQDYRIAQITPSNVDFNASGTITMILEDQFGHTMSIPFQMISTVPVAQAS